MQIRESTTQLTSVVGPMLSFPTAFQVVPDNIVAQEHILMKDYDVLVLPLDCTQTIPTQVFLLILQSFINIRIPNIIFMATHDEEISHEDLKTKSILRLTSNGSIPLDELVCKITSAVNPPVETIANIVHHNNISNIFTTGITTTAAAVPVCGSPSHRRSGLNKRKRRSEATSAATSTVATTTATTPPEHTIQYPYTHYGYPTTTTTGSSTYSQYTDEYGNSSDNAAILYQQQLNAYYWHKHCQQQQYNNYNTTFTNTNTNTSSNNSTTTDTTTTADSCDEEFEFCMQELDFIYDITTTSGINTTTNALP